MLTYLLISLAWFGTIGTSPIQQNHGKPSPMVYFTPTSHQYVPNNLYPFVQYQPENQPYGKALQSIPNQNELLFYPNTLPITPVIVQPQPSNIPAVSRFTPPPSGLVNAIYAWFAENNMPVPDEPSKIESSQDKLEQPSKDPQKLENPERPLDSEFLPEPNKNSNFPKKQIPLKSNGQRIFILNGQQPSQLYYNNYHNVIPRIQPVIPQVFTRNSINSDGQNIIILQPQQEVEKVKNNHEPNQNNPQNVLVLRNNIGDQNLQQDIVKPIRYHSQDLKPQNFVFLRENQPQIQGFSRQHLLIGRLLPSQSHDVKQQVDQPNGPIHQTHYVPVEVVPPQVPSHDIPQHDNINHNQHLSFIHIPVDSNIQPPQYIKSLVPIQISQKPQINQQPNPNQFLYLSPESQHLHQENQQQPIHPNSPAITLEYNPLIHHENSHQLHEPVINHHHQQPHIQQQDHNNQQDNHHQHNIHNNQDQQHINQPQTIQKQSDPEQQSNEEITPGVAALDFARFIANRNNGDVDGDAVVVDAKSDNKPQQDNSQEAIQPEAAQEPSIAQAQPSGVALAGIGGIASTAPRGTALVGEKGLAVASPHATAVAGPETNKDIEEKLN